MAGGYERWEAIFKYLQVCLIVIVQFMNVDHIDEWSGDTSFHTTNAKQVNRQQFNAVIWSNTQIAGQQSSIIWNINPKWQESRILKTEFHYLH